MAKGKPADASRRGGALSQLHPVELLSQVFGQLFPRNHIDSVIVDDVITGAQARCVPGHFSRAGAPACR